MLEGFQVQKVSNLPVYYKMLIYGASGAGKTRLAASASVVSELSPVLIIDVEGGVTTLFNTYPDVDVIRVKSWMEFQKLYNVLADGEHMYKTIILDSLTEIQKLDMMHIMERTNFANPRQPIEVPSPREYLISLEHMRSMVRAFRDLPDVNVIITSLAESGRDQNNGKQYAKPLLTGKFVEEVQAFFDEVFYLFVKEVDVEDGDKETIRVLLTGTTGQYVAKDRTGNLPLYVSDPTMENILKILNEKKEK